MSEIEALIARLEAATEGSRELDAAIDAHLRIGTQADNVRDMDNKGRRRWAGPHGATHHKAKLTDDDVRAIRRASGSYPEIAKQYGVSSKMIGFIKRGKSWRHVT